MTILTHDTTRLTTFDGVKPQVRGRPARDWLAHRREWLLPSWLIFLLLGMAAISVIEVLPGSPALLGFSGALI